MYSEQGKKQMKRFKEILLTAVLASSTSSKKMVPVTNETRVSEHYFSPTVSADR